MCSLKSLSTNRFGKFIAWPRLLPMLIMIAGRCKNLDNRSTKRQELRLYIMRDSTEARCELTGHDLHWSGDNKLYS